MNIAAIIAVTIIVLYVCHFDGGAHAVEKHLFRDDVKWNHHNVAMDRLRALYISI